MAFTSPMVLQALLFVLVAAFYANQVAGVDDFKQRSSFVSMHLSDSSRSPWLSCQKNAAICKDKAKNPFGGDTCCGKRICRDLQYDNQNCGACGRYCTYGKVCCNGQCTNINQDKLNCGKCGTECPANNVCTYGMCGYAGEDEDEEKNRGKFRLLGRNGKN